MNPANDPRHTAMGVIEVSGTDAASFLRAQLSNDVGRIGPDRHMLAAWCDAKGRTQIITRVLQRQEHYLLVLPESLIAGTLKRLQMYVLRARVGLADISEHFNIQGYIGSDAPQPERTATHGEALWLGLPSGQDQPGRALVLSPAGTDTISAGYDVAEDAWRLTEIDAGVPSINAATQGMFVPQMLNLHWLMAIDFAKGCYPGQEIIARLHYRGTLTRRLYRLAWSGALPQAGATVESADGNTAGTVVNCAAQSAGEGRLLAVVKTSNALDDLFCEGARLTLLDLPYPTPE